MKKFKNSPSSPGSTSTSRSSSATTSRKPSRASRGRTRSSCSATTSRRSRTGPAGRQHPQAGSGDRRTSACSTSWASPTWRSRSIARPAPATASTSADVEAAVQVAIGGKAFSQMVEGEKLYDIVLRLPVSLRDDPDVINRIPVDTPGSRRQERGPDPARPARQDQPARLGGLLHLPREQPALHPDQVQRPRPRPGLGHRRGAKKVDDPKTGARPARRVTRIEWSGEFAQMQEANARLMWIVPLSIGLIMGLLYTAFNSFKDALLVMVNVVAATMGGIWAFRITHTTVQHLGGGRVHLDLRRRGAGRGAPDLLLQPVAGRWPAGPRVGLRGAELRVRPVVMTSLTAALGLDARRVRDVDRLAGAEAAGDRGRGRDARDAGPDPLPDAGPLLVLPRPQQATASSTRNSSPARTTPTPSSDRPITKADRRPGRSIGIEAI